ncbi:MAG: nitroreductase family protein, partial [Anaerolineales bacterium]|nr:nitroreductase family protein [Anaerolineales bacterium]
MQELLTSHRSIRQFKDTPIPDELLNEMLYAGLRGSSSGNMQTWSVIVTRDPEMKEKLFVAHREQEMVRQAPVVLTFCADVFRMR